MEFRSAYRPFCRSGCVHTAKARLAGDARRRSALPMVLSVSQLPAGAAERLNAACSQMGFVAATGMSGSNTDANLAKNTNFEPGSVAVVPLIDGDLKVTALGTVTDVVGDTVYAFGHAFLGSGATDLPLATGKVDTVVASLMRSFKLGEMLEVKGALTADTATAVVGTDRQKGKDHSAYHNDQPLQRHGEQSLSLPNCDQ